MARSRRCCRVFDAASSKTVSRGRPAAAGDLPGTAAQAFSAVVADAVGEGKIKNHQRGMCGLGAPGHDVEDGRDQGADNPKMSRSLNSAGW